MGDKNKGIRYVVYEAPLKDIWLRAKTALLEQRAEVPLYEHKIDRSNLPRKQKEIQLRSHWNTIAGRTIAFTDETIYLLITKTAFEIIKGGAAGELKKDIYEAVMNANVIVTAEICQRNDGTSSVYDGATFEALIAEQFEKSYDLAEFEKQLEQVKRVDNSLGSNGTGYVYLEHYFISAYPYMFSKIDNRIKKLINKFAKTELTYCLRKDTLIVPQEYIDRGEAGIKEWQAEKRSSNKNNSLERKMISQAFAEKRRLAYGCIYETARQISYSFNWKLPSMYVDGINNNQRMNRLVSQIYETKHKQQFLQMTDDEMLKRAKDYWKGQLETADKAIDMIKIENI